MEAGPAKIIAEKFKDLLTETPKLLEMAVSQRKSNEQKQSLWEQISHLCLRKNVKDAIALITG